MKNKRTIRTGTIFARTLWSKAVILLLTFALVIGSNVLTAFAVTGNTVAEDGVYSSSITASKYKYGKFDKTYSGTLNVAVSDGKIAGLWITDASSDKMSKLITNEVYYSYVGETASAGAVQAVSGVDGISSASVTGSASSVDTSVKKQYVADIKGAIVMALGKASARSSSDSESTATAVQTVQGTASVSDSEGSKLVIDVDLDSDGKIVRLAANDASISDWSSLISKNADNYIGKTADQIETVSGATPYATAVNEAVRAAMAKTESNGTELGNEGNSGSNESDAGMTIVPNGSATIAVGETVTLDGEYNALYSHNWISDDNTVAKVEMSGSEAEGDAIVTGVKAGTVTITHTIRSFMGSSEEMFTVIVTDSGSGSGGSSGSTDSDPATGVTSIKVTKEWKNDTSTDRPSSVTVGVYNGSTKIQTLVLNSSNSWTATATGLSASASYTIKEDEVDGYISAITKGEDTADGSGASGWTAQPYGAVEAGKTYAFTYMSNGTTYLLGRSGTSVIGTTEGLSSGVPDANIGSDYKWTISSASSSYGNWYLKNNGNEYYLAVGNNYSTGYQPRSYLNSSPSSYYGAMHLDDDGSIWNGYSPGYNLYATGNSVGADSKNFTEFTPYLFAESPASAKTASYTITNTKKDSSSGTGGGTGGGEDEEPADPAHVKSIDPDGEVADNYTISLNVTGQSKTTTSTTQTGEDITAPYDILLVLDNTRSMTTAYGNTTRLAAMKSAAQTFVNELPAADSSKIAMVSFTTGNYQSIVTTDVSWTGLTSGKSMVSSKISALNAPDTGYDTYFTQPLQKASSLMDNTSGDGNKKFVVFFTDGAAAETVSTIQDLASAVKGKADATFSIGIVSGSAETQKAQALASSSDNYYDVTTAGTMGDAFTSALTTIQSQTTVAKVPMTNVKISDTLSKYVELANPGDVNKGVTLSASPSDREVTIDSVSVEGKKVEINLRGDLTDGIRYTVFIPVKPSQAAQNEANGNDDSVSSFVSNAGASLTYQYGSEPEKTVDYVESPKILIAKEVKLTYDANAGEEEVSGMPEPLSEIGKVADAEADNVEFTITTSTPTRVGYTFLGWADNADAAEAVYTSEEGKNKIAISEDKTIYAVWTAYNSFTLKYDANAGDEAVQVPPDDTYSGSETSHTFTVSETKLIRTGFTFLGWASNSSAEIPDVSETVSVSLSEPERTKKIYAVWRQDYRIIFEDYTKGEVTIGGITTEDIEGHDNCKIGTTYVNGEVTFTLDGDEAVVALIHEADDGMTYDKLMCETDNYQRLYCTDVEKTHQFKAPVTSSDVYVVLAYKGDVNLDGSVNLKDSTCTNKIYVDTYDKKTALRLIIGDADNSESVNLKDSTYINKSYVGTYTLTWDLEGNA